MNKKALLLTGSGFVSILIVAWNFIGNYKICDVLVDSGSTGNCPFILSNMGINLFPIFVLFLLSLITYKLRDSVYQAWFRFTRMWIPLSLLAIFLAPEYTTDWMFPVVKGTVAFWSSILFVVISLVLIGYKYLPPAEKS